MLEIIIEKTYSLQLPDDFRMPMVDENPLFLNDRIPTPHSITFEVPKTPDNITFFKNPNRVSGHGIFEKYHADIIHFGANIMQGELLLITVDETISLQFINAFMPDNAKKKMTQLDWGELDHGQMDKDFETVDYSQSKYDAYKQAIFGSVFDPDEYVTAPVRLADVQWDGHKATDGLKNALSMYLNYFNPFAPNWNINPYETPVAWGVAQRYIANFYSTNACIFPIIPFPYIHVLIDKFFGDRIVSNPFNEDDDLKRLVMVCFNHKHLDIDNYFNVDVESDETTVGPITVTLDTFNYTVMPLVDDYTVIDDSYIENKVQLKNFMQDYPFNEFLKNLLSLFGLSCYIGREIEFVYNNDLLLTDDVFDLTPYISGDPVIRSEEAKQYVLSYGERVEKKSHNAFPFAGQGNLWSLIAIHLLTIRQGVKYNLTYYKNFVLELSRIAVGIPPEGQDQKFLIQSKIDTPALSIEPPPDDDELEIHEVIISTKPLEMNIEHVWEKHADLQQEHIPTEHWIVPVMSKNDLSSPPHIMLDNGLQPVTSYWLEYETKYYRHLSNHNLSTTGEQNGNLSLLINDTDENGVFLKYHKRMADWYAMKRLSVTATATLTPMQLRNISNKQKIHVNGNNFYILKREYTLSNDRFMQVTFHLIEAMPPEPEPEPDE